MLAILIPFWGRHDTTAVVMRHYQRMAAVRKDMHLVAVGSEGAASRSLAEENGWDYVEAQNDPLSNKLSAGLARCRELNPSHGLLAMGSDDLVTGPWVDRCMKATTRLGLLDMYLLRRKTWEGLHWPGYVGVRAGESVGAHRFFPRALLDQLNWELWPPGLNCNLDGNLTRKLTALRASPPQVLSMQQAGCAALGISGEVNLTPWHLIARGARSVAPVTILSQFPEQTRADIAKLRG